MPRMDTQKSKEGSVGLNYPMLARNNYSAWSLKMKVFMQAQGVWDAVDPEDPKVAVDAKMDKVALAVIYQGIPEDMLLSIAENKTAKEAWDSLKVMSIGADRVQKAKVQTLRAEFESMNMKETDNLDEFCLKIYGIVTNIRLLGEKMEESNVVKKLLRAVPSKYLQIASTIEQFGDLEAMSVEGVVGRSKAHEERLKGQNEGAGGQLLLTQEEWSRRAGKNTTDKGQKSSNNRGKGRNFPKHNSGVKNRQNHVEDGSNSNNTGRDRSKIKCYNCQVFGHYASECRKPRRDREWRRDKDQKPEANLTQIGDDEPALLLTEYEGESRGTLLLNEKSIIPKLGNENIEGVNLNVWYLDNGASNHMTGQKSKFRELDESVTGQIKFGDGSMVSIKGKGSIEFKCKNGESRVLNEVYFIPNLRNNIIRLGQMSEEGNKVTLNGEFLWVYDTNGSLLMKVKRTPNRLYKIIIDNHVNECLLTSAEECARLWHTRLGHINYQALSLMSENEMVAGLPKIPKPKSVCGGCLMSKQARTPFPSKSKFVATECLELIHGDICGPITPTTTGGNRYFLLLVDDYSRVMWVYLLKSKDEALESFQKFKVLVENGKDRKIKVLRTDRGANSAQLPSRNFMTMLESRDTTRLHIRLNKTELLRGGIGPL